MNNYKKTYSGHSSNNEDKKIVRAKYQLDKDKNKDKGNKIVRAPYVINKNQDN